MNKTPDIKSEAFAAWQKANAREIQAARGLAYDVTFRADNPRTGDGGFYHDPASPELTAQLRAEYMAAHLAAEGAWALTQSPRDIDRLHDDIDGWLENVPEGRCPGAYVAEQVVAASSPTL